MPDEVVVFLIVAFAILGGALAVAVMAISAFTRVGRLERQVAELIARGVPTHAPGMSAAQQVAAPAPVTPTPPQPSAVVTPGTAPLPTHAVSVTPPPPPQVAATETPGASPAGTPPVAPPPVITPPRAPAPPPAPRPSFDWEAIIAGRWLFRVGLVAVAVGVSYFLKLAIDNDWIGPTGQVALGLIAGVVAIVASGRLVARGFDYFADGLTGLGAALLYLSIWAAGSYYSLIPLPAAFVLMAVVTGSLVALALGRDAQPLAVFGLIGGFLTPILLSTGRDAQVVLFTYLAVLNGGLLPIARWRSWRLIEGPAFVFTLLYFWGWYATWYAPERFAITALFAVIFFAEFAVIPLLRSRRAPSVDAEHVLLVPLNAGACLVAFAAMLWPESRWGLTGVAIALAAVHLVAAQTSATTSAAGLQARLLYGGVALTLATIAVPLRLDGRWITIAWALEGLVLMWSSFHARLPSMRVLAFIVLGIAIFRALTFVEFSNTFLFNAEFGADLVTVLSGVLVLWLAHLYRDQLPSGERVPFGILAVFVNILALRTLTTQVSLYFRLQSELAMFTSEARLAEGLTISMLWTLYATALVAIGMRTRLAAWRWQGLALFGITTLKVFLYDLSFLSGAYRVLSSILFGLVLLAVSFAYQRRLQAARAEQTEKQGT